MFGHCQGEIPEPRAVNAGIPAACSAIVARAMAKTPEERYQSAGEMLADLEAVAATLSGATRIDLPSQSGARPAPRPSAAPSRPVPAHVNRRVWIARAIA